MPTTITIESPPCDVDRRRLLEGLFRYNTDAVGDGACSEILAAARDDDAALIGGAVGEIFWGWLHITRLWVDDRSRGSGTGGRLLRALETEAARRGCQWAHLDTFSFQARPFYERQGYEVFGVLADFPAPHTRYYMKKQLGIPSSPAAD